MKNAYTPHQFFSINFKSPSLNEGGAGYTLVEVLTTIAIFLLISGSVTGLFLSSVMTQRRALASQKLFDNISYTLEYMSRALRMAKKDINGECLNGLPKYNYSSSSQGVTGVRFINYHYKCQEFYLANNGRISQRLSNTTSSAGLVGTDTELTPSDFMVSTSTSKFLVQGAAQPPGDNLQPRVTIFLDIETKGQKPESRARIKIQTTISQRDLDVQE